MKKRRLMDDVPDVEISTHQAPVAQKLINTLPNINPAGGGLTPDKIKEMMANAQKLIQERKAQLQATMPPPPHHPPPLPPSQSGGGLLPTPQMPPSAASQQLAHDKAQCAAELQAQIKARLSGLSGSLPPPPLIPGLHGQQGQQQQHQQQHHHHHHHQQQQQQQNQQQQQKLPPTHHQPLAGLKATQRQKRGFKFHEKGKFELQASRLRAKAQLERLQTEISQAAKKTGIASAARIATITPKKEFREGEVPDIKWWDAYIIKKDSYDQIQDDKDINRDVLDGVTNLVEHPTQMKSPEKLV